MPLDYAKPRGAKIDLALIRLPATGTRRGAVVVNPGGPGGSGFDMVAQGGSVMREVLGADGFDIVGFDPRGVDRSGGLRCITDAEMDRFAYLDPIPDTPEERATLDAADRAAATACVTKYGDTLRHYSTENTARDIDAIRAALGDDTVSYLGMSYGTYLGAVYATMFPDRVRAMVLDSGFDPSGESVGQQIVTQLVGFERAFDNWATWCGTTPAECAFSTAGVAAAWDGLERRLDATPITHSDGRVANNSVLFNATIAALYSRHLWPVLGTALTKAQVGDATALFAIADSMVGRDADGTFSTLFQSKGVIDCASGYGNERRGDTATLAKEIAAAAPRFSAGFRAEDLARPCDPSTISVTPTTISYKGTAPIVVIGGVNDPATPFRWSEKLVAALGPKAHLVTFTGEGHGFVLSSTCVGRIASAALVRLEIPAGGTRCEPDKPASRPEWLAALTTPPGVGAAIDTSTSPALLGILGVGPTVYGEVRTADLGVDPAVEAYRRLLTEAGFAAVTQKAPPGTSGAVAFSAGTKQLALVALSPTDLASPDLQPLAELTGSTKTVLVFLVFSD